MKQNNHISKTKNLVLAALFAALACAATMSIRIPTVVTNGYIHPGDAIVILCGIFLNPVSAFLAAGIGSCMADLLGGYFIYVPITFAIKGLVALICCYTFRIFAQKYKHLSLGLIACGIVDMILVAGGYFLCEIFLYGFGASLASIPANLVQGASGLIIAMVLYPLLSKPYQAFARA